MVRNLAAAARYLFPGTEEKNFAGTGQVPFLCGTQFLPVVFLSGVINK